MSTTQEQVTEEHLRDVFNDLKGIEGRNRAYVIFEDFKRACLKYQPACLQPLIQASKDQGSEQDLLAEIEEHFRNIVESCSPILENGNDDQASPRFKPASGDDDDLLGDLGNTSTDEGKTAKPVAVKAKKLKVRPTPHYLTGTAASRAMQRPKSPFLKAGAGKQKLGKNTVGGPNQVPLSMGKKTPTSPMANTAGPKTPTSAFDRQSTAQWIEDIPVEEMKLYYESFRSTYMEFLALSELTNLVLQSMGIILKGLRSGQTSGIQANRFNEFSDDEEQQMEEDGVYSSVNKEDILTMKNLDDSTNIVPHLARSGRDKKAPFESTCQDNLALTKGMNLKEESQFTGDLHFETVNKKY